MPRPAALPLPEDLVVRDESGRLSLDRTLLWSSPSFRFTLDRWNREEHSDCRLASMEASLPGIGLVLEGAFLEVDGDRVDVVDPLHAHFYNLGIIGRSRYPWGGSRRGTMLYVAPEVMAVAVEDAWGSVGDPGAPFPFRSGRLSPAGVLRYRRLVGRWNELDDLEAEDALSGLLRELLGVRSKDSPAAAGLRRRIPEVQAFLSAYPDATHRLESLARRFRASPYHLSRVFREEAGTTLSRYVVRSRLAQALPRVLDGDRLTDIAAELGFSSHSHFTTAFRREFGRAPSAYRG